MPPPSSPNGRNTRKRSSSIRMETVGNGCFAKAFSCSKDWRKTIASRSANPAATCRPSWCVRFQTETISSPTSTPSVISMETAAYLEWKTTTSRYPEEPDGLLALDPQLICYSWMSGISDVALIAFVRKRFSEIQYLKTTITDKQREEFGRMVEIHGQSYRSWRVLAAQRHPVPPKRLHQLPTVGAVSRQPAACRIEARPSSWSE